MSSDARVRIDAHRLMRKNEKTVQELRVESVRTEYEGKKKEMAKRWKHRAKIHALVFVASFIFSVGVFTLGTLLWVEPDDLFTLVVVAVVSSLSFVATFTWLRMFILHTLLDEYPNKEEDPGHAHHLSKSIAYGFLALVLALVLVGILINAASADIGF